MENLGGWKVGRQNSGNQAEDQRENKNANINKKINGTLWRGSARFMPAFHTVLNQLVSDGSSRRASLV